ncbi:hypothetical protein [Paludisphaera mucosa]|uniref:Uncharacterized protein n=1 Tax=Paludisphaera mucosa TaxID=3030827 RepID=A0ABT6FLS4_9BACT|nr:hypothetical protein [Paludisphaera mucosa]MDG3008523.1 hypothetical protein [Paludisphaera mucosa]
MIQHEDGTAAEVARPLTVDRKVARRFQDAVAAHLVRKGVSTRGVGLLINLHPTTISKRLALMPAEVRRHYERDDALSILGL